MIPITTKSLKLYFLIYNVSLSEAYSIKTRAVGRSPSQPHRYAIQKQNDCVFCGDLQEKCHRISDRRSDTLMWLRNQMEWIRNENRTAINGIATRVATCLVSASGIRKGKIMDTRFRKKSRFVFLWTVLSDKCSTRPRLNCKVHVLQTRTEVFQYQRLTVAWYVSWV